MAFRLASVAALLLVAGAFAARQSPINIIEKDAVITALPALEYSNFHNILNEYSIENTGHSAQITLTNRLATPTLTGGPLGNKKYKFQQAHFHWGKTAGVGSEHLINGQSTSMEVHLVCYNTDYDSFTAASTKSDGLAVVGFFIESAQSKSSFNDDFQRVVDGVTRVKAANAKVSSRSDLLRWVVPYLDPTGYFTYAGSLTTEPFLESVTWIVYKNPILIRASQIEDFRKMHGSEHDLHENFRAVQPLDGRVVKLVA